MRGKKTDAEFVSEFIVTCAKNGITNSQDVVKSAEHQIRDIDAKIVEVEFLKKKRSKLIDVINSLGTKVKNKSDDKKTLEFYQLSNLQGAQLIAKCVCDEPCDIKSFQKNDSHLIKEMLASKILRRENEQLAQGDEYHSFIDFCLQNGYSCVTQNIQANKDSSNSNT